MMCRMSCGFLLPSQSMSPASTMSPSRTSSLRPIGHEVLEFLAEDVADDDDALALDDALERHRAGDHGEDGRGLGLAGLEELADARQAARDVHGLGAFLEHLGQGAVRP